MYGNNARAKNKVQTKRNKEQKRTTSLLQKKYYISLGKFIEDLTGRCKTGMSYQELWEQLIKALTLILKVWTKKVEGREEKLITIN